MICRRSYPMRRPLAGLALAAALLLGNAGLAQSPDAAPGSLAPPAEPPSLPAPPAAADPEPPPASFRPGFIDAFGKLIEQSVNDMSTTLGRMNDNTKAANDAAKSAAEAAGAATKEAAGGLLLLPVSRMIAGRERCAVAPNGAPDCAGAVSKLCKANGLATGRSMDVVTAESCSAAVLLARRYGQPEPEKCRQESYVTKALCQ